VRQRPGSPELWIGWKLGSARGPVLRELKREEERRMFREGLNLLYVGLTRARDRLLILQQWPEKDGVAAPPPGGAQRLLEHQSVQWHHVATDLAAALPGLRRIEGAAPKGAPPVRPAPAPLVPPATVPPLLPLPSEDAAGSAAASDRARKGSLLHGLLREVLVREAADPSAARAYLAAHPLLRAWPEAGRMAAEVLEDLSSRGWDRLPRRTEYELAGAGKAGSAGRADLVLWRPDRRAPEGLILVDFKLAGSFQEDVLDLHRQQLGRYREALGAQHPDLPIEAWLVGLEARAWVRVF
jgi:ATP-dependent exoDNAse (exonuclease V) beta subunit